jgi:hypothetical protein
MAQNYKYWVSLLLSYFAMKLDYHVLHNARNNSVMPLSKNRKKITIYFLLSCLCRGTTCKNWLLLEQFSILIGCTLLKCEHCWSAVSIYKLHFGLKTNSGFSSLVQSRGGGRRISGWRSRGKIRIYFLLYLLLACVALIIFSFSVFYVKNYFLSRYHSFYCINYMHIHDYLILQCIS